MKPASYPPPAVCVAIHDVAPATWPRCATLLAAVERVAPVPLTLLVVPNHHRRNPGLPAWYRDALAERIAAGDELALHGFFHLDEGPRPETLADWYRRRILTAGEGEFAALPASAARRRLNAGRQWFERHGWAARGFVAPAWLLGRGAWHAVSNSRFAYTTTATHFHLLHPWQGIAAPAIAWSTRSRMRRALSLLWNGLRPAPAGPALVRIALHPDDALHPDVVRQAQHLLEVLLHQREAMTKIAFATAMRPSSAAAVRSPPGRVRPNGHGTGTGTATSDSAARLPPTTTPASTSLG